MKRLFVLLLFVALLVSCGSKADPSPTSQPTTAPTVAVVTPQPSKEAGALRQITIFYTNDEHGWMEANEDSGGAAGLTSLWREQHGYSEDGPFLILSGGDMWTGPAISSWFDGESMAEVMNAMGYDAAAIGNHEFDFGLDGLAERAAQSEFPFLAANIRDKATGELADVALPYVVQEVNGVRVGVIGLASLDTPQTTKPEHVAAFDFVSYQKALAETAPQAKADGAELLVVIGHICASEMRILAPTAAELGITVIGGGHCHERVNSVVDGVALIAGGSYMQAFVKVEITFDTAAGAVLDFKTGIHDNPPRAGDGDGEVAALVADWRARSDEALSQVIGYVEDDIDQRSDEMYNLITDAWLWAYPAADVAMTNKGGIRQSIPAGDISLATIVGVLPFDNTLVDVELSGMQLRENLHCCYPVLGGMTVMSGYTLADGTPLDKEANYHVLVNDFMYGGGDGFSFQVYDPDAYDTTIDWRQPVIDWIISLDTSPENPLDQYLDPVARQR